MCWCGKSCDHQGATETTVRSERKKKQCKRKKEPRRTKNFALRVSARKKEQNKRKDLLYCRYDLFRFVTTARVSSTTHTHTHMNVITARTTSMTCTFELSQLAFHVRLIHYAIISCMCTIYTSVTIACSSCAVCTCKLPEIHLVSDASRFQTRR